MELKSLLVDTKSAWVEYPGLKGLELELINLARPALQALRKRCLITKFDRKSKMPIESLDEEKYVAEFTKATIKNWKGFKLKYLEDLLLVDISHQNADEELPYTQDNAELLVTQSSDFDTWLTDAVFDLDNFRSKSEGRTVEKAG